MTATVNRWHSACAADRELADLVDAFACRIEAGEVLDVDRFAAEHPAHAAELRALLPGVSVLAELGLSAARDGVSVPPGGIQAELHEGVLGDFRILREVGRGGMGVVYEAEQISLRRRVALKVLPFASTLDSRQLQRFKNEAQAAACLHHTNIVPVFATGVERGVHFYAMQFIEGQSLAEVIADLGLRIADCKKKPTDPDSIRNPQSPIRNSTLHAMTTQRTKNAPAFFRTIAELGIQAAEALEHAHQMGIVHRDIKPANLMIQESAIGNPQSAIRLWITDFGLAQFQTDAKLTMTGDLLGTLRYMSPEQALAKRVIVDHRTDIYSLGVTLYELLTLQPAFDGKDRQEILRQIAFEEPKAPRKIDRTIPAELETIVLKAMEKDPNVRYATAGDLADDLRRYSMHEPIKARRPSLWDKARKYVQRRPGLARAAMVMLTLGVIGLGLSTWLIWSEKKKVEMAEKKARIEAENAETAEKKARIEAENAETEAAIAKAVNDFLQNDLLAEAAPEKNPRDKQVTVEELLERASARIGGKFSDQPRVEAALQQTIGIAYRRLGNYRAGLPHLTRALEINQRILGSDTPGSASTLNNAGELYRNLGRYVQAEPLLLKALEMLRSAYGDDDPRTLGAINNLGVLYESWGKYAKAEPLFLKALEGRRRLHGDDHHESLTAIHNLAFILKSLGHFDKAETLFKSVYDIRLRTLGENDLETLTCMHNLAELYYERGQYEKSENLYHKAFEGRRRVLGEEHPRTLSSLGALGTVYEAQGQTKRAEPLMVKALEAQRRTLGEEHPDTLTTMANLAHLYEGQSRFVEAEKLYTLVVEGRRRILGDEHPGTLIALVSLSSLYRRLNDFSKAEPIQTEALAASRRVLGEDHPVTVNTLINLAGTYWSMKKLDRSVPLFEEALRKYEALYGADHYYTVLTTANLAVNYRDSGRTQEGIALMEKAWERVQKRAGPPLPTLSWIASALGETYGAIGQYDKAEALLTQAGDFQVKHLGQEHFITLGTLQRLGALYRSQGKYAQAEPLFKKVLDARLRIHGKEHSDTLNTLNSLGVLYQEQAQSEKAEQLFVDVLATHCRVSGEEHPSTLEVQANLADLYEDSGEYAKAEAIAAKGLEASTRVLGEDNLITVRFMSTLACAYEQQGQFAKAEALHLKVLDMRRRVCGVAHIETIMSMRCLASNYYLQADYGKAEPIAAEAFEASRQALGTKHRMSLKCMSDLAGIYEAQGRAVKAEPLWRESLEHARTEGNAVRIATASAALGFNLVKQQRCAEGELLLRKCLEIRMEKEPDNWSTFNAQSLLGGSLLGQKRYPEAEPLLLAGYAGLKEREAKIPPHGKTRLPESVQRLVQLYEATNQPEKAAEWRRKLETPMPGQKD